MKILCLTPWFPVARNDKTGNFVLDSVEALGDLGHQVSVLVTRPQRFTSATYALRTKLCGGETALAQTDKASTRVRFYLSVPRNAFRPVSNWFYHRAVAPTLANMARECRADVIHAHTEIPGATAVRVATEMGLPSVVTIHGINTDPKLNGPRQRAYYHEQLSRASRIVLVGEPLRSHVASMVGRSDNYRIVHNGFRPPKGEVGQANWDEPLRLISVSDLHQGKGIDLTLTALRRLEDSGVTNWTYNVVGGGNQAPELQQLARDLGLSAKVKFVGPCDHDVVYRHLTRANVFVLPSYIEAFGIAYLEAMALGLLAIGVSGQGPSEFIQDGDNGFLVKPGSVDSLHACLRAISEDMTGMSKIAARGRDHVRRDLTWRSHAEHLTAVFAEVV